MTGTGMRVTADLPCLSIRQPWVWAIFYAGKDVENRDWPTKVRGRVAIHASKGMVRDEWEWALAAMHGISEERPFPSGLMLPAPRDLPRGCLIGTVNITDCVTRFASPWFTGPHGFVLSEPELLPEPIPYKGRLGFFPLGRSVISGS